MGTNRIFNILPLMFLNTFLILSPLNNFQTKKESNLEKEIKKEIIIDSTQNLKQENSASYNESTSKRDEFIENARKYVETPYRWGGRLTKKNPGLDCLGLVFLSYSKTFETNWRDISVYPSEIIEKEQLGNPIKGLNGVLKENLDISKLEKGDIVYLLTNSEINDKSLAKINGQEYWPWHVGIYSDKEKNLFLEAKPGDMVMEHSFNDILKDGTNKAFFVTRID